MTTIHWKWKWSRRRRYTNLSRSVNLINASSSIEIKSQFLKQILALQSYVYTEIEPYDWLK